MKSIVSCNMNGTSHDNVQSKPNGTSHDNVQSKPNGTSHDCGQSKPNGLRWLSILPILIACALALGGCSKHKGATDGPGGREGAAAGLNNGLNDGTDDGNTDKVAEMLGSSSTNTGSSSSGSVGTGHDGKDILSRNPKASASLYSEDSVMAHYLTDPQRALLLLDDGEATGTILPQRARYLEAIIVYNGLQRPDSCIKLCQRILKDRLWETLPQKVDAGDKNGATEDAVADEEAALAYHVDVLALLAAAATSDDEAPLVVHTAREGMELIHGKPQYIGEEADFQSRMGFMMAYEGQQTEGLKAMHEASRLAKSGKNWSSLLAYLNNTKRLYSTLLSMKQYGKAIAVVREAWERLKELERNPQKMKDMPGALSDSTALRDFIDYYRAPYAAYLTRLYTEAHLPDSASTWMGRFFQTSSSEELNCTHEIIAPLISFGRYDEARDRIEAAKKELRHDTICDDYIELLKQERALEMRLGHNEEVMRLADRIFHLTDTVYQHYYYSILADNNTQYKLQEEKLARQEADRRVLILLIILALILVGALSVGAAYIYRKAWRRRHYYDQQMSEAEEKRQSLVDELAETQQSQQRLVDELNTAQRKQQGLVDELTAAQRKQQGLFEELTAAQQRKKELHEELTAAQQKQVALHEELTEAQQKQVELHEELHEVRQKKEELNEELSEAQRKVLELERENEELAERPRALQPEELYARAVRYMEKEQPFRDPAFDIQTMAQTLYTNRAYLSAAVNKFAGTNFRTWIATFRVDYAKRLLMREPTMKTDVLATRCGFENRSNLYRHFKNIEGVTPSDWVEKQKK